MAMCACIHTFAAWRALEPIANDLRALHCSTPNGKHEMSCTQIATAATANRQIRKDNEKWSERQAYTYDYGVSVSAGAISSLIIRLKRE